MDAEKRKISETTSGQPPEPGFEDGAAPAPIDPTTGMHKSYWILSEAERAKGFIRPVRRSYIHMVCHSKTSMSQAIAETYARNPTYYGATFCCACRDHFPVGEHGQFVWDSDGSKVGT